MSVRTTIQVEENILKCIRQKAQTGSPQLLHECLRQQQKSSVEEEEQEQPSWKDKLLHHSQNEKMTLWGLNFHYVIFFITANSYTLAYQQLCLSAEQHMLTCPLPLVNIKLPPQNETEDEKGISANKEHFVSITRLSFSFYATSVSLIAALCGHELKRNASLLLSVMWDGGRREEERVELISKSVKSNLWNYRQLVPS